MLDPAVLKDDARLRQALSSRGADADAILAPLAPLDERRKALIVEVENLKRDQNLAAEEVARKKKAGEDVSALVEANRARGQAVKEKDTALQVIEDERRALLLTLHTRPERRDTSERFDGRGEARFDAPDAAARSDLARRRPVDARIDMPRLYAAASRHVAAFARYSSRIGRDLPSAQPLSRVWRSASGVFAIKEASSGANGVLDVKAALGGSGGIFNHQIRGAMG